MAVAMAALGTGCLAVGGASEGGVFPARRLDPRDVGVPAGYAVDVIARGLTFPTGITFDEAGRAYVVESGYAYGEVFTEPRLLALNPAGGPHEVLAAGEKDGPWTGVDYADGLFYVAEAGVLRGGRILRIGRDGARTALVEGLPSYGDHHVNGPAVRDGWVYFGLGSATNSGVVGPDNAAVGWLRRRPDFHDIPCRDVTLLGINYESPDVEEGRDGAAGRTRLTGAFHRFGTATHPGEVIPGRIPCTGALLRTPLAGGALELVAWGFRNPFGLAFDAAGVLYVTDNGFDRRGSRPIAGASDLLWRVDAGAWYGFPDFVGDEPVDGGLFGAPGGHRPRRLLANAPGRPPRPVAQLAIHSSSNGLDISRSEAFGLVGHAFVAQFGDLATAVGKDLGLVGFKVVTVDLESGRTTDFAVNRGRNGPASRLGRAGLERPVAVRFAPREAALYVVDFGTLGLGEDGRLHARPGTGAVWRIRNVSGGRPSRP
jgi:hypothetical protein